MLLSDKWSEGNKHAKCRYYVNIYVQKDIHGKAPVPNKYLDEYSNVYFICIYIYEYIHLTFDYLCVQTHVFFILHKYFHVS